MASTSINITKQELRNPSGFLDMSLGEAIQQQRMIDIIRKHYEAAGYAPLETPIVERTAILLAKAGGEIKNQIYGLRLLNPAPGAEDDSVNLAMRFDLTVPFARFAAAQYGSGNIQFPFRRYAIGPVFRGERPKRGRFRQFIQADIDVIGDGELHLLHDAEMVDIIARIFTEFGVGPFTIRINNRKVLAGILRSYGCDTEEKLVAARNVIDEVDKVGHNVTVEALANVGIGEDSARELLHMLKEKRSNDAMLDILRTMQGDAEFMQGVTDLDAVVRSIYQLGVPEKHFRVDVSLARGLDYYTGSVYEVSLDAHPNMSVAGGGRYDNLAENYTTRHLPGVGISIGVTRLLSRLMETGQVKTKVTTVAPVMITTALDIDTHSSLYLQQARELREAGIGVEVHLNKKRFRSQMDFAIRRGFTIVVITHQDELAANAVTVRNLQRGEQQTVARADLVQTVRAML